MDHDVHALHCLLTIRCFADIPLHQLKAFHTTEVIQIGALARGEIVHATDAMPCGQQCITDMTSDEAGTAGNEDGTLNHVGGEDIRSNPPGSVSVGSR